MWLGVGEGQWEAACRAGAATPFHFGDVLDASWANFDGGYTYGPGRKGVYRQRPVPVGFFGLVNRWGLAELHGQLFEWCGDQWHPDPKGEGWPSDGQPWEGVDSALEALATAQKEWKLLRGGSWFNEPHYCRAAYRYGNHPANVFTNYGNRPWGDFPSEQIDALTVAEKVRLLEQLWQSLCSQPDSIASPDWHLDVLMERRQAL